MWKFHVLFLVFVFFSVKESNATYVSETKKWTAGSAVDVTFGPEDAVYCKLEDNHLRRVFEGFGPCRVVVDRVTKNHRGYWKLWIGAPGTVVVHVSLVYVDVVAAVDTTPRVTGNAMRKDSMVILNCSMPEEHEVVSCAFSDPTDNNVFIATREEHQEVNTVIKSYDSYINRHYCALVLLKPRYERSGIWRCSVNTTQVTSHGFLFINKLMLDPDYESDSYKLNPVLRSTFSSISGIEGDATTMDCSIDAAVRYCYFRAPNGTVYNVSPSTSSPGYEYIGNGFDAGECGIRFNNIWASDVGLWSCNVGLEGNFEEQRDFFNVYVNQRFKTYHFWLGSSVVVSLVISDEPKLEYCRFVRSDGLGFTSEHTPPNYVPEKSEADGICALTILNPTAEDLRPWTIVAKVIGIDGELSMTTTLSSQRQPTRGLSSTTVILLWSFLGTIMVFLFAVSCLPKRNRKWAAQRAASIRNSFRRQPQPQHQPQQQNVTDLPKPVHTDILTDLPLKF